MAATRHANETAAARAADRDWVELGRVLRPHGLDGCLLVALHSDDPSNLIAAKELRLTGEMGEIPFRVAGAEPAGPGPGGRARVRLWLVGMDSRERADRFARAGVAVAASALAAAARGRVLLARPARACARSTETAPSSGTWPRSCPPRAPTCW